MKFLQVLEEFTIIIWKNICHSLKVLLLIILGILSFLATVAVVNFAMLAVGILFSIVWSAPVYYFYDTGLTQHGEWGAFSALGGLIILSFAIIVLFCIAHASVLRKLVQEARENVELRSRSK